MAAHDRARQHGQGAVAFDYRDFRLLFAARILNGTAANMLHVALGWEIYRLTGNALVLGLVGLAIFLPNLLFFLIAGVAADRLPRHWISTACYGVQALASCGLMVLLSAAAPSVMLVLACMFVFGIARAFLYPANAALLANIVRPQHFQNAMAWGSSGYQVAVIVGPIIGGALLLTGAMTVLIAVFMLQAAAAVLAAMIAGGNQRVSRSPVNVVALLAGLRYIWQRKIITGAISLDLFAVLFGGATALLPIFAADILQAGALGLGVLRSGLALGSAACGLWLTQRPIRRGAGRILLRTVGIFGAAIVVFGLSTSFWLSFCALAVAGAADMVSVFIRHTLVQVATPDEMRGRVGAVSTMFIGASNELGEFESGAVAAWLGVVPSVIIGGVATIAIALSWGRLFPQLRAIDTLHADDLRRMVD